MKGCNPTPAHKLAKAMWMGKYTASLPPEPDEFDVWYGFASPDIFTNDFEGSCVECETANAIAGLTYAAKRPVTISKDEVHKNYRTQTGGGDSGLDLGSNLDWENANGTHDMAGGLHKPGPHGALDTSNLAELSKACYYFGGLKIGICTPSSFMNASPGDVVDWSGGNPGPVDHCVALTGRKLIGGVRVWIIETWGFYVYVTDAWMLACTGEAWARYDDHDRFTIDGHTVEGWDEQSLLDDWAAFTGEPVPPPEPPVPPTPGPRPRPCPRRHEIERYIQRIVAEDPRLGKAILTAMDSYEKE
jgi:hypothetical protein